MMDMRQRKGASEERLRSGSTAYARNSERNPAKLELAAAFKRILEDKNLGQAAASELLGIPQPKVSAIVNGKVQGISMQKLMELLNDLGIDVEIVIKAIPKKGRIHVTAA
jgi:predicted XRE-type DNA-binding protein